MEFCYLKVSLGKKRRQLVSQALHAKLKLAELVTFLATEKVLHAAARDPAEIRCQQRAGDEGAGRGRVRVRWSLKSFPTNCIEIRDKMKRAADYSGALFILLLV